jgi:uncharacterized protein YjiS (DUF1127 family)
MQRNSREDYLMNQLLLPLGPADHAASAIARLQAWLREAMRRHRRHADARAAASALSQLDPRTLRDIGLDRSEITSAAWEFSGLAQADRRAERYATL